MTEDTSANRDLSMVYDGAVGQTLAATSVGQRDYLIDPKRFPSEGNWAFCRFDSEEVPALRLGFQRGGFNGGFVERQPSPLYLQLHLEVMTREGAILWLPSGIYRADDVISRADSMNIRLDQRQRNILSFRGWPTIDCHMCSDEGDLQVDLQFCLRAVTVLPDSRLPDPHLPNPLHPIPCLPDSRPLSARSPLRPSPDQRQKSRRPAATNLSCRETNRSRRAALNRSPGPAPSRPPEKTWTPT